MKAMLRAIRDRYTGQVCRKFGCKNPPTRFDAPFGAHAYWCDDHGPPFCLPLPD